MPRFGARFGLGEERSPEADLQRKLAFFERMSVGAEEFNKGKRCGECFYGTNIQSYNACQYICIAGTKRPCPPDSKEEPCKVFVPKAGNEELLKAINNEFILEPYYGRKRGGWH